MNPGFSLRSGLYKRHCTICAGATGIKEDLMKKVLFFAGIGVASIAAAVAGGMGEEVVKKVFSPKSPSSGDVQNALIQGFNQAAEQINQGTPTMIDEETRMDKATVGPGATLTYHYSLLNYTSDEIDSGWINSGVRESITKHVCNREDMKPSLQYGGTYSYSYSGNDQKVIGSFQVTREDCGYSAASPRVVN